MQGAAPDAADLRRVWGARSIPCLSRGSSPSLSCISALVVFLHPRGSGRWVCSSFWTGGVRGEPRLAPIHGAHPPAAPGGLRRLAAAGNPVASIKGVRREARRKQGAAMLYFYNSQQNGQLESELNADPQLRPKPPSPLKRE